jgi:hypothetical protein
VNGNDCEGVVVGNGEKVRLDPRLWLLQQLNRLGAAMPGLRQMAYNTVVRIRRNRSSWRMIVRNVNDQSRQLQIRNVMDWIAQATVNKQPLVSVVLPTRDRRALLERAIASVTGQTYANWELLVVDDASVDGTAEFIAAIKDERIRGLRGAGAGVCAARNVALGAARGSLVAYLDDDNVMHSQWLKSVVWAFEQYPTTEILYGAFMVDDKARLAKHGSGQLPQLYFHRYQHDAAAKNNVADMSCMAHRAGLPEARFDESLREMGDWDLLLRMTRDRPPLELPAIACFYYTDAPTRLTNGPTFYADLAKVREKNSR